MDKYYHVIILGNPYFQDELKESLAEYDAVDISDSYDASSSEPCLYLYYGQIVKDKNYADKKLLAEAASNLNILPIVKDTKKFTEIIPDEIKAINAIQISSVAEISNLRNRILQRFDLLDDNRKVFISYKRTDSSALAHQLYDALTKARFQPFLDSYSLAPGVHFQNSLKQELAGSEILLMLNSANFEESDYCKEEIEVASEIGLGIVQVVFSDSRIPESFAFAEPYKIDDTVSEEKRFKPAVIDGIVNYIESCRARGFEFKRKAVIQQFTSKNGGSVLSSNVEGVFIDHDKVYIPMTGIPHSSDMFHFNTYFNNGANNSNKIFLLYNGLHCLQDKKSHLNWLNESLPVKTIDVTLNI